MCTDKILPKKVRLHGGVHVRMIKARECCYTKEYGGCQYFCLAGDIFARPVGLATCYHHSGLDQHIQNSHPNYWQKEVRFPA